MPYKVSLYIPCYNGEKNLKPCLTSIFNQTYPIAEVLVVDDGSTDGSLDIASQFEVKVLEHGSNRSITAARNTALENSQGEFIASVDADVQLDKFWLERIMRNFPRPEVGGVGGRIIETNTISLVGNWILSHRNPDKGEERIDNVQCLPATSVVYRKRSLLEIGGFNDDKRYDHSDLDASMRVKAFGYDLVHEPRALCYHHFSGGLLSLFDGHWRFKKDAYINLGLFKNIHGLKRKIRFNLGHFLQAMMDDIDNQNFSISKPKSYNFGTIPNFIFEPAGCFKVYADGCEAVS